MQKKREEKAITLIALIVTIIVLLILAGVAIATLTGDNRINNKSWAGKRSKWRCKEDGRNSISIN